MSNLVQVKATFDGQIFDPAFKIDMLVDERLVLEIKAVEQISKAPCEAIADLPQIAQAARRAASQFFRSDDEGRHSAVVNDYRPN